MREIAAVEHEQLAALDRAHGGAARALGEQRHLAEHLARAHHVEDDVVALGRGGHRLETAVDHDVELRSGVALVEHLLARGDA